MSADFRPETTLRERARSAIADEKLRDVLARASDRLAAGGSLGQLTLANYEELRDGARALRSHIIGRLPEILERLADAVAAAGGHVFWAADAAEATAYVRDIARRSGARLAVKSKSMVTEEIGLNEALTAVDVEVVETDLGEWIIQLAHERPSHIIAPAIHKTRTEVRDLFNRIANGDLSDLPEELCAFARAQLRERFLHADLGITGCNFAVAETGTVVLVTNEGNGRMVTSLPRVHVAVMGMERVVETWEQLDLMMALLPRAATGQDISVYVSMTTGPRRPGEVDGPDEFHLVILDNGRSEILGTEFQEMLNCIRCGACLNVCPVYRQIGGHAYGWVYSGPMGAVLTPLLHAAEGAGELAQASSLCGACYDACPVKIPLQDLLLGLRRKRAESKKVEGAAWSAWAAAWSRPSLYRASTRAVTAGARITPQSLVPRRWTDGRDLPRPPKGHGFRSRLERGQI